jgi:hypothetical protein
MNLKPKPNIKKHNREKRKKAAAKILATIEANTIVGHTHYWLSGKWI